MSVSTPAIASTSKPEGKQKRPEGKGGGGFKTIQTHYTYCALYLYYYYISSTSDHQALDPGGWRPLL